MDERQSNKDKRYAELVGDRLRRIRQERGMSLQEVCARSGGSFVVSTLSAYERGTAPRPGPRGADRSQGRSGVSVGALRRSPPSAEGLPRERGSTAHLVKIAADIGQAVRQTLLPSHHIHQRAADYHSVCVSS
jgi:transcriptional regulator with XRE-family HTH domain